MAGVSNAIGEQINENHLPVTSVDSRKAFGSAVYAYVSIVFHHDVLNLPPGNCVFRLQQGTAETDSERGVLSHMYIVRTLKFFACTLVPTFNA